MQIDDEPDLIYTEQQYGRWLHDLAYYVLDEAEQSLKKKVNADSYIERLEAIDWIFDDHPLPDNWYSFISVVGLLEGDVDASRRYFSQYLTPDEYAVWVDNIPQKPPTGKRKHKRKGF